MNMQITRDPSWSQINLMKSESNTCSASLAGDLIELEIFFGSFESVFFFNFGIHWTRLEFTVFSRTWTVTSCWPIWRPIRYEIAQTCSVRDRYLLVFSEWWKNRSIWQWDIYETDLAFKSLYKVTGGDELAPWIEFLVIGLIDSCCHDKNKRLDSRWLHGVVSIIMMRSSSLTIV